MQVTLQKPRILGLDIIRGSAIVLMIGYHFFYDLDYFSYVEIDFQKLWFWPLFRYLIVNLFLISVGISLVIAHKNGIRFDKVIRRFLVLAGMSLLVSIGSYYLFPNSWIYFGILHFIALSSVLGLLFLKQAFLSLALAILVILTTIFDWFNFSALFTILQPLLKLPDKSEDLVLFFPWFSAVLLGIFIANFPLTWRILNAHFWSKLKAVSNVLAISGRHSLLIYLLHQPILFSLFWLYG